MKNKFIFALIFIILILLFVFSVDVCASSVYTHDCFCSDCDFSITLSYPDNVPVFDYPFDGTDYHDIHYFFIVKNQNSYTAVCYNMKGTIYDNAYFYMSGSTVKFSNFRAIDKFNYNSSTGDWVYDTYSWSEYTLPSGASIVFSSCDIYTSSSALTVYFPSNEIELVQSITPFFSDTDEVLSNLSSSYLYINAGTVPIYTTIQFSIINSSNSEVVYNLSLDGNSPFYHDDGAGYYYSVPTSNIASLLSKNNYYVFRLSGYNENGVSYDVTRSIYYVGLTDSERLDNNISSHFDILGNLLRQLNEEEEAKLQELINTNKENNKGILDTIKDIVSYLNPFSDNFFVYKLLELLGELLKDLFVPDSEYIVNYVNDLNEFFSDRFGLLYYPFDLVLSTMDKIVYYMTPEWERPDYGGGFYFYDIDYNIKIPQFKLFGATLIPATEIDFNGLLENETFNSVHDIYLIFVDVIIVFLLIKYLHNVFVTIFGGKYIDDIIGGANRAIHYIGGARK